MTFQDWGTIATAISVIFLAIYTFETHKGRKNSIRPTLILLAKEKEVGMWALILKNIGLGSTTAIKIQSFIVNGRKVRLIEDQNYLSPNEETEVVFQYENSNEEERNFSKFSHFNDDFEVIIRYADIEGKHYFSKISHNNNHRFRLVESKEVSPKTIKKHMVARD